MKETAWVIVWTDGIGAIAAQAFRTKKLRDQAMDEWGKSFGGCCAIDLPISDSPLDALVDEPKPE